MIQISTKNQIFCW